jgi:hypothetical protein
MKGPFPSRPYMSEAGYQSGEIGVGCSSGTPGGDPEWNAILSNGTYPPIANGINDNTVWPITATVAVSERMYGLDNKASVCYSKIPIRSARNTSLSVMASIVDFCPTNGCLWPTQNLSYNVDIYGEKTWVALGGGLDEGRIDIQILWPQGITPSDTAVIS